jgi:hypothetical protein
MLPVRYTPPTNISELTGRVIGHAQDDGADRQAMILEGADGFVHVIPHDQAVERYRAKGRLAVGHVVTLKRINGILSAQDLDPASRKRGTVTGGYPKKEPRHSR